jgi:hypothetical protein
MTTWSDVERNSAQFEKLDTATLEEFLKVPPPVSQNPTFNIRFEQTMHRIRDILSQRSIASTDSSEHRRHKQMMVWMKIGVVVAVVIGVATLIPRCASSRSDISSPASASPSPR